MAASHGDFATELKLLEPLAQAGNSDAQVMLGDMYKNGDGVPTDYPKAFGWYQKAAQQGNVQAEADLGTAYFDRTSSTHSDQDMNRDYLAAARWWRKAAEQGSATAQANLGIAYELGQGVPANIADAARWFQRSAEQGNATAQYHLGIIAEYGEVGPADNAQACVWFSLAAARGNKEAAVLREALEKALTREQVEDIQSRVAEWKPRHVDMR
ncbi:MAG: sel1 repeat family protein [Alphaproteobacteria bacterium]|nr:sel1 repeat family protein [Alphaproteobacteria bacterium]